MNEFNSGSEINWYAVGSLLVQFALLAAGVWFARNFLKAIWSFQEQVGALLKLSITSAPERQSSDTPVTGKHRVEETSKYWLPHCESQTASEPMLAEYRPGVCVRLVRWLNQPMHHAEVSAWRRLINWLQAPADS